LSIHDCIYVPNINRLSIKAIMMSWAQPFNRERPICQVLSGSYTDVKQFDFCKQLPLFVSHRTVLI